MNATTKSFLICALSFSTITPSIGQSISEKLAQEVPKSPSVICIKDQCSYIIYNIEVNNDVGIKNLLSVSTELNGKTFYGWKPLCLSCSIKEEDHAAAKALVNEVKTQFPEVEIGYRFGATY